jgi:hypothetical protein
MNGKLASRWRLVGGALMVSALVLGGCVADTGDDAQVDESQAALSDDPAAGHGGLEGVVDTGQGVILETPVPGGADPGDPLDGPSDGCEPEPNPWEPGTPPAQSGCGSAPPDPDQQQQGQMKH